MSERVVMLTTLDNPFSPIEEFDAWLNYDTNHGYNSCAYLARIVRSSDELSDTDQNQAIEDAIDEIIKLNLTGNYKKVIKIID